jgi:hypothetical protein
MMRRPFSVAAFALVALVAQAAGQQPVDSAYTRQIRVSTSEPRFNSDLTDYLPADPRVPTPLAVLGYVPGTVGHLSHVADINRYFRALASATPRVRVFSMGMSDEGREMITAAIADSATIADLDRYREVTRRLADPRGLEDAAAGALIDRGKPIYYLTGSIHSPETGSPEMLMELAYRLAVDERPLYRTIREHEIVLITPVLEVDGRDRMVDVYNYGRSHQGGRPPLVYWGRYTAHDNNRDGMVISQTLSRNVLAAYFQWHPTVLHDLHESVPFLYTSTGSGPYNRAIDAVTVDEWYTLAMQETSELTKRGMPGVWTHGFYDGWTPNYIFFIANLRNSVGRFYETYTSFGAECDTARLAPSQTSIEWFRPNPPIDKVRWCIRNNINYQQSGVLIALDYVARNGRRFLENFWLKSRRAVERGRTSSPHAWVIPAAQSRRVEAADLVNLFRLQGIEVHRADRAFTAGGVAVAEGDYVVRLDQPYGPLADNLLGIQIFRPTDPNPYDDTGWTFGALRNVVTRPIADSSVLAQPMTLIADDVRPRGELSGPGGGRAAILIPATTESNLIVFRFRLRQVRMYAAEDTFSLEGRGFPAGTVIIPLAGNARDAERSVTAALDSLGLTAVAARAVPTVARHELDVPRIGLVHSWTSTQDEGWVRYVFDRFGIPYTYLSTQQLRDSSRLAGLDVLVLPNAGFNVRSLISGLPMAGPPVPWRRTPETPNLGRYDQTDDVRPGIGLDGLARLDAWLRRGGVLITEGATATLPVEAGIGRGISVVESRQLQARGAVFRSQVRDLASPIAYGYADTLPVYFSQAPLFQVDPVRLSGSEQERDSSVIRDMLRSQPRVIVRFHPRVDSLRISGQLEGGSELAGRPAVVDVPDGAGHLVLFAIRPFWRWETQGSFALAFNAIMNWNDLGTRWPTEAQEDDRGAGGRRGRSDSQGTGH